MSGFDFDALRDPDAPMPGTRQREQVAARARKLHARSRLNRLAVTATAIVAVVAIVIGVDAATRSTGPEISVGGTTTTVASTPTTPGASSVGDRFIPPTTLQGGLVVLPVTLPDGETFTLRYPPAMRIAELGFAGSIGVDWPVETGKLQCCGATVSVNYTTIAHVYGNAKPITVYHGPNGEAVPFFHASDAITSAASPAVDELVFQFGPWLVRVQDVQHPGDFADRMTDAQRATWARSLTGRVDSNGYLVLHAKAPLTLSDHFEGLFGSPATEANGLEVASHLYCGETGSDTSARRRFENGDGSRGVSWCSPGLLHLSATGSPAFVNAAANKLQVSPLTPPAGGTTATTPTTTTSTVPAASNTSPAVSASFVSASHGFALEQNGTIAETTDSGTTWHRVGTLGTRALPDQIRFIRFIGPSDGFVFGSNAPALLITHDAGAHWIALNTPFSSVMDLAISRGVVYVVALPAKNTGSFGIWSTPVGHLVWKRDPLSLQIGAAIPREQIVLAAGGGWILNEDRTVISGARLSPSGQWAGWKPPCLELNGPAILAASTSTDLVAACSEHDYGGGPVTSGIYFSHDAGATFTRRPAPGYALVAVTSPSPDTAMIVTNGGLQRTTDGGSSWHLVVHFDLTGGTPDYGFTTPTQGFLILGSGEMLMTYDAGATWQRVKLP